MEKIQITGIYEPVVKDGFEGFSCKLCGQFVTFWQMFGHFENHVNDRLSEILRDSEGWPEDELTA